MGEGRTMTQVSITNAGGTLDCESISWQESQMCEVAIRPVPLKTSGSKVDTKTWVLKPKKINTRIRLSDAEKITLEAIYNANVVVTITAVTASGTWTYTAWLERKPLIYQYAKQGDATREWITNLSFLSNTYNYTAA